MNRKAVQFLILGEILRLDYRRGSYRMLKITNTENQGAYQVSPAQGGKK